MIELLRVPMRAPPGVIAVLLASAGIMSRSLKMPARTQTDPHIAIRGRDGKAANASELGTVPDSLAVRVEVKEAAPPARSPDARIPVAGKEKSFGGDDLQRLELGLGGRGRLGKLLGRRGLFTQFTSLLQRVTDL